MRSLPVSLQDRLRSALQINNDVSAKTIIFVDTMQQEKSALPFDQYGEIAIFDHDRLHDISLVDNNTIYSVTIISSHREEKKSGVGALQRDLRVIHPSSLRSLFSIS
jgi:hypothetical protein